ncbi:MAG: DNA primase [Clostridiaceae bacterium]
MAYPESWLNELIGKNDIVSVASAYIDLKPKGRRLWGLCPVHGEKTPSFSVSPDRQLYYCFGCHIGGSVIQFIMDVERLTFPEAVEFLANRVGMALPEEVNDAEMLRVRAKRERLSEACKLAARFYMETLLGETGGPGRAYLKRRGITSDSVRRFGLGYAPDEWETLKNFLGEKGYSPEELVEAGLLVKNEQTGRTYDAYRGRLIFPIVSAAGRVIGFGARVLNNDDKPKYINTGDTLLYNKRNNLYGLNQQKSGKLGDLVIVEGYTDVIGLYEAGVTNAVASLGTALTTQQARLLKRYVTTVYIAYDGDAAGQNATIRGLDILTAEGLSVRVIVFPDEQDPDEFVREHGKEAFDVLKENALSLNAFKLESMARAFDLSKENEREQYAIQACRFISSLSPVERERYYQQLSRKTGYSIETIKAQGATTRHETAPQYAQSQPLKKSEPRKRTAPVDNERTRAESALLCMMLHSKEAAMLVSDCGCDKPFAEESTRDFARALTAAYERGETPNIPLLIANMEKENAERITAALREETECAEPEKAARDCIRRIEKCDLAAEMEEIKAQLAEPSLSAGEREKKLREMQKLNLRMRGL